MRRTARSHYVSRNHVTRVPRAFVYLDTEAHRTEEGRSEIQTWRLGVTALDRRRPSGEGWAAREWADHVSPRALWEWVESKCRTKARTVLVAHNLAYDLRLSDAFTHLPALGWSCIFVRLDGGQAMAVWRKETRTLAMVDSLSWVNVSLEKLAPLVDGVKVPLPTESAPEAEWWDRCRSDVAILGDVWRRLMAWVEDDDLGNWKPTGAGQSWAAFRHRFKTDHLLVHEDDDARSAERASTMTGRTEAWRWGKLEGGPFVEWDFEAAYCRIGVECEVPVALVGELSAGQLRRGLERFPNHAILAEVDVSTEVPVLPFRDEGGISWPVGTFTTTAWSNELALARSRGAQIVPSRAWVYRTAPALRAFCAWVLEGMAATGGHPDPVVRLALKHWSRSLIGRTAAQWSKWDVIGRSPVAGVSLGRAYDRSSDETFRFLQVGHDLLRARPEKENPDAMVSIMAFVMAEARCRLFQAMESAGLENVVYVDTDSVIVDARGDAALALAKIPGLRIKSVFESLEVLGPRQIIPSDRLRASGIPTGARDVGGHVWEGTVWTGIGASLSAGERDRVRVALRRFRLSGADRRRVHVDDGSTRAHRLGTSELTETAR